MYALESYCVSLGIIIDIVFSIHIKELMTRELFIIISPFYCSCMLLTSVSLSSFTQ